MKLKIILLLLFFVFPVEAAIFSDNFENWTAGSLSPWTTRMPIASNVSTTTVIKYSGNYGLYCPDAAGSNPNANVSKTLEGITTSYHRFYAYFPTGTIANLGMGEYYTFWYTLEIGTGNGLWLILRKGVTAESGVVQFRLQKRLGTYEHAISAITPAENTWYCFEVCAPSCTAVSICNWWIDGSSQPALTVDLTSVITWNTVRLGYAGATIATATPTGYFDEYIMNTSYIGILSTTIQRIKSKVWGGIIE